MCLSECLHLKDEQARHNRDIGDAMDRLNELSDHRLDLVSRSVTIGKRLEKLQFLMDFMVLRLPREGRS